MSTGWEGVQVSRARRQLLCGICRQQHGACIQCAGSSSCYAAFHPLCARGAGHITATVDADEDYDFQDGSTGAGDTNKFDRLVFETYPSKNDTKGSLLKNELILRQDTKPEWLMYRACEMVQHFVH